LLRAAIGVFAVVSQGSERGIGIVNVAKGFSGYTQGRCRVPDIQHGCFPGRRGGDGGEAESVG